MAKGALRVDWYPGDALDGMKFLTVLEELAFRRILDLLYTNCGELPDDDHIMGEQTRTQKEWPKIKESLLKKEKIFVEDGMIKNDRCTEILAAINDKIDKARSAGKKSGKRRQVLRIIPAQK